MRMHRRHHRRVALVGTTDGAHAAVALWHVLHQPVDGVVAVGSVIDRSRVERTLERPGHDVVAFGSIFSAHVLVHDDVAGRSRGVVHLRHGRGEMRAVEVQHALRGVVWRACEQDRRLGRALRNENERFQLHAVAHRNHDFALDVVELIRLRCESCGRLTGKIGRGPSCQCGGGANDQKNCGHGQVARHCVRLAVRS